MMSENLKIKIWNCGVCCLILFCIYAACITPGLHERANEACNKQLWESYSGFYNRGYEVGYEDAKAGRKLAKPVDFVFENGVVLGAKKVALEAKEND